MHKYWGKKPSNELSKIVSKYTTIGDIILDPFCGFGGIGIEGVLQNRNVILNDLNPSATFISNVVLDANVNLKRFEEVYKELKKQYENFEKEWYTFKNINIQTILRDKNDTPIKIRGKSLESKDIIEYKLSDEEISEFVEKENRYRIDTWYPTNELINNSRISAKKGMRINDLFSKRALICQSYLFDLINKIDDSPEKNLLLFSFTSNLANCSKLVPPILSRGDMAQGAWMTGFYIGETYLENNVFHYFENRVGKSLKGKKDYFELRELNNVYTKYRILNEDAKKLSIDNHSIDFVFTDFPYGDTVPYFEQSQLWNSWLKYSVDYENEIVVSDSKDRNKDILDFDRGISTSISEISRVLRENKFFVFTFHSLYGKEWNSIISALKNNNFRFIECEIMLQKTLPPRQLNRINSIKGDILVVYQKRSADNEIKDFDETLLLEFNKLRQKKNIFETNDLVVACIKSMLITNYVMQDLEFKNLICKYFEIDEDSEKWKWKNN